MQNPEPPTLLDSSHLGHSHYTDRVLGSSPCRAYLPAAYSQHCAPAAEAAFERHAGRAMQILALPPITSLPPTPLGRREEPVSRLAKLHNQFSPARSGQHSYPSPPMSDSHSPSRRSAHLVEPVYPPYHAPVHDVRRLEPFAPPPPPPPPFDHRPVDVAQHLQHPPLYPGEATRAPPHSYSSQSHGFDAAHYGSVPQMQSYYMYPPSHVPAYHGTQSPGPPGTLPPAIIPQQPLRQKPARRTKAHVASACVNCKKAHLSCDVQRPCGRCVASGKQDSCKDVQHKKRGRPRLRENVEFGKSEEGRRFGELGVLKPGVFDGLTRPSSQPAASSDGQQPYTPLSPVAFLNLDLVIQKSNPAFQELVSPTGSVQGRRLMDLLDSRSAETLHSVPGDLRNERDVREPTYMPPITPLGHDPLQSLAPDTDVDYVSKGFTDRTFVLNFRLPNDQHQSLKCQIRLAKTSLYFVTLKVLTPPRPVGPPLLTQHLAPPTPIRFSHSLSAPTTAPPRDFASRPAPASAGSAPTSPYYNFSSVRTSLPTISPNSYGSSPSHTTHSSATGQAHDQSYFSKVMKPATSHPQTSQHHPHSYPPVSRTESITSESPLRYEAFNRDADQTKRLEGLQLPPIRTAPATGFGEGTGERDGARERGEAEEGGKRRRLNISEVLE